MANKRYHLPDEVITLTEGFKEFDERYGISVAQRHLLPDLLSKFNDDNPDAAIDQLKALLVKHPGHILLKSMLALNYITNSDFTSSHQLAMEILKNYPDFIDAKRCLAYNLLRHGEPEKADELFEGFTGCSKLFVNRKAITYLEYGSYTIAAVDYSLNVLDFEAAQDYVDAIYAIPLLVDIADQLQEQVDAFQIADYINPKKDVFTIFSITPIPVTLKTQPPKFNHNEVVKFYQLGFNIENSFIHEMLLLPRKTFVADLLLILSDLEERYSYLSGPNTLTNRYMLCHAIAFLGAVEAEETLPDLLKFLKNNDTFLAYWIYPGFLDDLLPFFTILGKNNINQYVEFLLEPGISASAKSLIADSLFQISMQFPAKYPQVIAAYQKIFGVLNGKDALINVFDDLLALTLCEDALELNYKPLVDSVKLFYYNKTNNPIFICTFEEMVEQAVEESTFDNTVDMKNIYQFYMYNQMDSITDEMFDDEDDDDEFIFPVISHDGDRLAEVNINKLCPCGSGKKFKKCHGSIPVIHFN